jgi:single-strand DNA-binding protein
MLRVTLIGNLGAEPEARFTPKGTQLVQFRVAVNQVRMGPDGERQENTEWFRVRTPPRMHDFVQRLTKGARVLVVGRLDIGHYQSRDGEPRPQPLNARR